uniref:Predicted protein n=1 Tax=Hordeum vulgare subsp. vulgare TaxID=112509 RepID=F2D5F8_HORVV|nr:predicted protein [Hordeum vulgare subsp. vulgare]
MEREAWDADLGGDVRDPPEGHVGDNGVGAVLQEQLLVDRLREVHGAVHPPGVVLGSGAEALHPALQADVRERVAEQAHRVPLVHGARDRGGDQRPVGRRYHHRGLHLRRPRRGHAARQVGQREEVPPREEGQEEHPQRASPAITARVHTRSSLH